jgi:hypothetical protein
MVLFEDGSNAEWKSCNAMMFGTTLELAWMENIQRDSGLDVHPFHPEQHQHQEHQDDLYPRVHQQQIQIFELRRDQAEGLLSRHSEMVEGTFVVRTNERNNVVLSLLHNGQPFHIQADVFNEGEETFYRQLCLLKS